MLLVVLDEPGWVAMCYEQLSEQLELSRKMLGRAESETSVKEGFH